MRGVVAKNSSAVIGALFALSFTMAQAYGNSSIGAVGSEKAYIMRHHSQENNNTSFIIPISKMTWQEHATEIFQNSRPFTEEEANAHEEMLKKIGTIIVKKAFDL
ncbi:MAG: hypothetical protein M1365_13360 [Actinobacteria bacterium]|nr:hypothetical protein [Actinomycetota bacterium]